MGEFGLKNIEETTEEFRLRNIENQDIILSKK